MADANILQGAIFHEDPIEEPYGSGLAESAEVESQRENAGDLPKIHEAKNSSAKPAAHRVRKYIILTFVLKHNDRVYYVWNSLYRNLESLLSQEKDGIQPF